MVKNKHKIPYLADGNIDLTTWLNNMNEEYHFGDTALLTHALQFTQKLTQGLTTIYGVPRLEHGLEIAMLLFELKLDQEAIAAGIICSAVSSLHISDDKIRHELGEKTTKLIAGLHKMDTIADLQRQKSGNAVQIDKIRKMLLAMATDIRVVLIKLADRLSFMRGIKEIAPTERQKFAQEIIDIYAPLANRLGIGQIKWELEDLAFRYLEPDTYKLIAAFIMERRSDRESRIKNIIVKIKELLSASHIKHFEVSGRAKHIYSIFLKMERKELDQDAIYDTTALRILVDSVEDCYQALSLVHATWTPIIAEFDDYIAHPKPNGYRSIHTAVIGDDNKHFEIQIRTFDMHEESERGVAAHWVYKENKATLADDMTKMKYLQQLIQWHQDVAPTEKSEQVAAQYDDQVYVITPAGDILDLVQGATPVDAAYQVHTDVGHSCRGAKINGHIVPLTYQLKTGDRIDIITIENGAPSRDWLNAELGYVKSNRSRSKIRQWFKQQDIERSSANKSEHHHPLPAKLTEKNSHANSATPHKVIENNPSKSIIGAADFLTRMARCCKPIPGDTIIGYITQGRGISIHKKTCPNRNNLTNPNRFIEIDWNKKNIGTFITEVRIIAEDKKEVLNDIMSLFANEKIELLNFNSNTNKNHSRLAILATLQIQSMEQLQHIMYRAKQLPGVLEVVRVKK